MNFESSSEEQLSNLFKTPSVGQCLNQLNNCSEDLFSQEIRSHEHNMTIQDIPAIEPIDVLLAGAAQIEHQKIQTYKKISADITINGNDGMSQNQFLPMSKQIKIQSPHQNPCLSNDHQYGHFQPKQLHQSLPGPAEGEIEKKTVKKGDDRKNMYKNVFNTVIKKYNSSQYSKKVEKIHKKLNIENIEQSKRYCQRYVDKIKKLYDCQSFLDYSERSSFPQQKIYKRAFFIFYQFFMRKKYPLHVVKSDRIKYQLSYLKNINILIYLPSIREKPKKQKTTTKGSQRSSDQSNEENSLQPN